MTTPFHGAHGVPDGHLLLLTGISEGAMNQNIHTENDAVVQSATEALGMAEHPLRELQILWALKARCDIQCTDVWWRRLNSLTTEAATVRRIYHCAHWALPPSTVVTLQS